VLKDRRRGAEFIEGTTMLRNVKDLRGYALRATDGVIGRVEDFYVDDEDWGIRYLVVNTGSWLSDRRVLPRQSPSATRGTGCD
jgi:hypothetical protein